MEWIWAAEWIQAVERNQAVEWIRAVEWIQQRSEPKVRSSKIDHPNRSSKSTNSVDLDKFCGDGPLVELDQFCGSGPALCVQISLVNRTSFVGKDPFCGSGPVLCVQ